MERGGGGFLPYFDPDFDSLPERINPPMVCVDNDIYEDCTLVKVDSVNKNGILLEMVQVLTDLDLFVSKSYISSDGGWFMDVFHVTDQMGKKITDPALIRYIQQSIVTGRRSHHQSVLGDEALTTCLGKIVETRPPKDDCTAIELTGADRPGLLSDISAMLSELSCNVTSAEAWSHKSRVAMILHLTDEQTGRPISDDLHLSQIEEHIANVVGARHEENERWHVRLIRSMASLPHIERRLHQLMQADHDYENEDTPSTSTSRRNGKIETRVSIECCWEKDYSVVNIKSRDRPKLLFDTVCTLTDMSFVVSHAAVSGKGSLAYQEYFIRRMDGHTLDSESERKRVAQCLVAAIERRPSRGLSFNVCSANKTGILSDITRVFREQGLSLTKAEISTRGEKAMANFAAIDASGDEVKPETIESVRKEIGGAIALEVNKSQVWPIGSNKVMMTCAVNDQRPRISLGSLLWSGIGRFSHNFGSIRS